MMVAKKIGPNDVLSLKKPTTRFLCPASSSEHNIEFLRFIIRDDASKRVFFEVGHGGPIVGSLEVDGRSINYTFSENVLRLPVVSTRYARQLGFIYEYSLLGIE